MTDELQWSRQDRTKPVETSMLFDGGEIPLQPPGLAVKEEEDEYERISELFASPPRGEKRRASTDALPGETHPKRTQHRFPITDMEDDPGDDIGNDAEDGNDDDAGANTDTDIDKGSTVHDDVTDDDTDSEDPDDGNESELADEDVGALASLPYDWDVTDETDVPLQPAPDGDVGEDQAPSRGRTPPRVVSDLPTHEGNQNGGQLLHDSIRLSLATTQQPAPPVGLKKPWEAPVRHCRHASNLVPIKTATSTRPYRLFPGKGGLLESTLGALIPHPYEFNKDPNLPWVCPVRSCRRLFSNRIAIGAHFTRHKATLLNDNRDGTFSVVGTYSGRLPGQHGVAAIVISQSPGDPDEPIVEATEPPYSYFKAHKHLKHASYPKAHSEQNRRQAAPRRAASTTTPKTASAAAPAATSAAASAAASSAGIPRSRAEELKATVRAALETSRKVSTKVSTSLGRRRDFETPIPGDPKAMWAYIRPFLSKTTAPPELGHVQDVIGLPRVRDIEWNTEWPNGFFESFPRDITALIMHVTGERPPRSCARCIDKRGPFHGCIVLSRHVSVENIISCSNCWYHGRQRDCDLQPYLRSRLTNNTTVKLKLPPSKLRDISGASQPPAARRSVMTLGSPAPSQSSDAQTRSHSHPRSHTPQAKQAMQAFAHKNDKTNDSSQSRQSRSTEPRLAVPKKPHSATSFASSVLINGQTQMPSEALEMEDWEVAPGRLPSRVDDADNIAFSNAYLSTKQSAPVADGISFRVEIVHPGTVRVLERDSRTTRICSLASGKLKVRMQGEPELSIGPHGMFKIRPGVECTVVNRIYIDCMLHISSIVTED